MHGQVKLAVTHHTIEAADKIVCDKPLAFLMDPPKQPDQGDGDGRRKRKKTAEKNMTAKNFGSVLNIAKLKKAGRLVIGWRVRHPHT